MKKKLPNITISREENTIVIEIDVKQIVTNHELLKEIRDEFGPNISEKAIKTLAIRREIVRNFIELAEITGGEFKDHIKKDLKFSWNIAEKLLSEYIKEEKKSAEVITPMQSQGSSEKVSQINKESSEALRNVGKEPAEIMSASLQEEKNPQESAEIMEALSCIKEFAKTVSPQEEKNSQESAAEAVPLNVVSPQQEGGKEARVQKLINRNSGSFKGF